MTTVSGIREIDLPTEHLFGAVPTRWRVLNGGAREVHRRWTGGELDDSFTVWSKIDSHSTPENTPFWCSPQ